MRILFFKSNKFMQSDITELLLNSGHHLDTITYVFQDYSKDDFFADKLEKRLKRISYDIVFSLNFYPIISDVCYQLGILYVSWIYDSPAPTFFRFARSTNRIFLFDKSEYMKYKAKGHSNIFYLPLASNTERIERTFGPLLSSPEYLYNISFLGVLYDKFNLSVQNLTDSQYDLGILKGYAAAQTQFQNLDLLKPLIQESGFLFEEDSYEALMTDLLLEATSQERHQILYLLSNHFSIDLFSTENTRSGRYPIQYHGAADYENEMPFIFRQSRINLNITLRTIKTAIPLRIFDIFACGGFLITNPQKELMDFFEPEVDFIPYTSHEDLIEKCSYYLAHEKECFSMAQSAYQKVKEAHTLSIRLKQLFEKL